MTTSSGLDDGCQANVYVSPSGCNQVTLDTRVLRGTIRVLSSGGPDVYPGIDAGLKSQKSFKFPG